MRLGQRNSWASECTVTYEMRPKKKLRIRLYYELWVEADKTTKHQRTVNYELRPKKQLSITVYCDLWAETEETVIQHVIQQNRISVLRRKWQKKVFIAQTVCSLWCTSWGWRESWNSNTQTITGISRLQHFSFFALRMTKRQTEDALEKCATIMLRHDRREHGLYANIQLVPHRKQCFR